MLFNSYIFIFAFLPAVFSIYFLLARFKGGESAISFLVLASLFFYGWWNPIYLVLIVCSMGINYFIGAEMPAGWMLSCHSGWRYGRLTFLAGSLQCKRLNIIHSSEKRPDVATVRILSRDHWFCIDATYSFSDS